MAQRRMFSPLITDSDAFLDMPASAQNLYFHLGMRADDDGFVSNPKKVLRMIGGAEDDLKILIAKRFILTFESGVIVIKHWRLNNLIRKDWYRPTIYKKEMSSIMINENGIYSDLVNENATSRSRRLGKVRLGKVRLENTCLSDTSKTSSGFDQFWSVYPKKELKKRAKEIWDKNDLDKNLVEILDFIEKAKNTERWSKGFVKQPTTFLNGECWNDDLASYGSAKKDGYVPYVAKDENGNKLNDYTKGTIVVRNDE